MHFKTTVGQFKASSEKKEEQVVQEISNTLLIVVSKIICAVLRYLSVTVVDAVAVRKFRNLKRNLNDSVAYH